METKELEINKRLNDIAIKLYHSKFKVEIITDCKVSKYLPAPIFVRSNEINKAASSLSGVRFFFRGMIYEMSRGKTVLTLTDYKELDDCKVPRNNFIELCFDYISEIILIEAQIKLINSIQHNGSYTKDIERIENEVRKFIFWINEEIRRINTETFGIYTLK